PQGAPRACEQCRALPPPWVRDRGRGDPRGLLRADLLRDGIGVSLVPLAQENVVGGVGRAEERPGLLASSVVAPAHRIDALDGGDARERAAAAARRRPQLWP